MSTQLPSPLQLKEQAKRLRVKMNADGTPIAHAKSLELIAHQYGFRDWNTMIAVVGNSPPPDWQPGNEIKGTYLSQPFKARVASVKNMKPGWYRLELHLDEAIDVVASDGFSNLRKRIRGVVGPKGYSIERTSDGQPHLQIDL